jgi:hypothetical protein
VLGGLLLVVYVYWGALIVRHRAEWRTAEHVPAERKATWRMPSLALLDRPTWSRGRLIGMYALRGYLVLAVVMLLVKAIELGVH